MLNSYMMSCMCVVCVVACVERFKSVTYEVHFHVQTVKNKAAR